MRNTEEELIEAAKRGDQLAYARLEQLYRAMIRSQARQFFMPGGERNDLVQEGRIGFWKAVRDYSSEKGKFHTFAEICVKRQIITAVKAATRKKQGPLNGYISLNQPYSKEEDSGSLLEALTDLKSRSPEDIYLELERSGRIASNIKASMSRFEASVLVLYYNGATYEVIAKRTGTHAKAVDNGLQRVKKKYRGVLAKENAIMTH